MKAIPPVLLVLALTYSHASAEFAKPVRLKAGEQYINVESPGYACPMFEDVDGDGLKDLVVGQFRDGALTFYKNAGSATAPKFSQGQRLPANGKPAEVPGVW